MDEIAAVGSLPACVGGHGEARTVRTFNLKRAAERRLLRRNYTSMPYDRIAPPASGNLRRKDVLPGLHEAGHVVCERMAALEDMGKTGLEAVFRANLVSVHVGTEHAQARHRPCGATDGLGVLARERLDEPRRVANAVGTQRHIRVHRDKGGQ